METTNTLRNTLVGVDAWSDIAMRTAIEAHMTERLWTAKDLAAEMGTSIGSVERWLGGDTAMTFFRANLKRYLEALGYPGTDAAVANARRLAAAKHGSNGHEPEVTFPPTPEPANGHDRIDAAIETINAEVAAGKLDDWSGYQRFDLERSPDEEPEIVTGEFVELIPTSDPSPAWSLPAGFTLLPPATLTNAANPPGITISKTFSKAHLSRRLHTDELQSPSHVLIATKGDQLLIVMATNTTPGAMRLGKNGDVSSSVARYVQTIGKPAGFYAAVENPDDGSWLVQF